MGSDTNRIARGSFCKNAPIIPGRDHSDCSLCSSLHMLGVDARQAQVEAPYAEFDARRSATKTSPLSVLYFV